MNIERLLSEPISLIFMILLIAHMVFLFLRSYLDARRSKRNVEKIKIELSESEKRVQEILGIMEKNKSELLGNLESLNSDLKNDLEKLKQFQDVPKAPRE